MKNGVKENEAQEGRSFKRLSEFLRRDDHADITTVLVVQRRGMYMAESIALESTVIAGMWQAREREEGGVKSAPCVSGLR